MSQSNPRVMSLNELIALIGPETVIALDRDRSWVFDPGVCRIKRLDGRFFDVRMFDMGQFEQPGVYEEPGLPEPPAGDVRIVGHVVVTINPRGLIHFTTGTSVDGNTFIQATMTSLSNPSPVTAPANAKLTKLVQFNPKRIGGGMVLLSLVEEEFPDDQGITIDALKETTDGRTQAALAALGL